MAEIYLIRYNIVFEIKKSRMTQFKKRYRRMYAAWVVVSILAVISMIFFLIAPIFTYR